MKQLEIIEICSASTKTKVLKQKMTILYDEIRTENPNCTVTVYMNSLVNTTFSMHLLYKSDNPDGHQSAIGELIAASLREHGIVNHSVWIQQR